MNRNLFAEPKKNTFIKILSFALNVIENSQFKNFILLIKIQADVKKVAEIAK